MDFRAAFEKDIAAVFHNMSEFSETKEIWYNGVTYFVPAVVSEYVPEEYRERSGRRDGRTFGDGIYSDRRVLYIPYPALGFLPCVNNRIELDGKPYNIASAELLQGKEILLTLEGFDE